jgi:hypothetical protein
MNPNANSHRSGQQTEFPKLTFIRAQKVHLIIKMHHKKPDGRTVFLFMKLFYKYFFVGTLNAYKKGAERDPTVGVPTRKE